MGRSNTGATRTFSFSRAIASAWGIRSVRACLFHANGSKWSTTQMPSEIWPDPNVGRPEMHIRRGVRKDAENLCALAIQVWLHTYATEGISSLVSRYVLSTFTAEKFEALLSKDTSAVFVAEAQENLLGYATVTTSSSCPIRTSAKAELATLYVQEHFIGKGIGHLLLGQAEQWAKQREETSVWLTVNSKKQPRHRFLCQAWIHQTWHHLLRTRG